MEFEDRVLFYKQLSTGTEIYFKFEFNPSDRVFSWVRIGKDGWFVDLPDDGIKDFQSCLDKTCSPEDLPEAETGFKNDLTNIELSRVELEEIGDVTGYVLFVLCLVV